MTSKARQRLLLLFLAACLLTIVIVVAFISTVPISEVPVSKAEPEVSKVSKVEREVSKMPVSKVSKVKLPTPGLFKTFDDLAVVDRQAFIRSNFNNYDLADPEKIWLKNRIKDKSLNLVTRNDMATWLVHQQTKDPELWLMFVAFYEDQFESYRWREFSVQFIGQALPHAEDKEAVHDKLLEIAKDYKNLIAGTAMLQLAQQEGFGNIKLDERFETLLDRQLQSKATDPVIKLSLIGIIGKRKDKTRLPLVRKMLKETKDIHIQRTSIATIGLLGNESDLELIQSYQESENTLVKMAANGAVSRLKKEEF